MTNEKKNYMEAMRTLNQAAYAALETCRDTTELPNVDRQSLRLICWETDRLFDDLANSGLSNSRIREA